jgi:hypothetical protein
MAMLMNLIVRKFFRLQRRSAVQRKRSSLLKNEVFSSCDCCRGILQHKKTILSLLYDHQHLFLTIKESRPCQHYIQQKYEVQQVVQALNETEEWDQDWSKEIIAIIQAYDNELKGAREAATAQQKARQKRQKIDLDQAKFQEESDHILADTEHRI